MNVINLVQGLTPLLICPQASENGKRKLAGDGVTVLDTEQFTRYRYRNRVVLRTVPGAGRQPFRAEQVTRDTYHYVACQT